ncbi:LacI family transcriptional regulator [Ruminiclostridium sufflavum DSM 19573]|uniref:LacI family transcriptional regulator n=1 Tax=Ruminiclostridium sufflavum DSM 19573 TaxID=1121337 RepID=A0A318XQH0_9FIRM|nr:LacI family DNA-binding transcriptional regulator [Ruminiclostridium sufflavum]PYG89435.1 LacI family transcriptional regulator [Ruminiclostridium sufflavum DSM 19573]
MVTINDIANAAGVSIATVSRALNSDANINESTKAAIQKIADEMNYRPKNYRKRIKSTWKQSMIGVIISCNNYPWFNRIMSGISSVLESEDITPIFANTSENPQKDITCINKLKDIVQGLLVVTSTELDGYNTSFLEEINQTIPVVTMIRNTNIPCIDSIKVDGFRPTYDAINILLDGGHRHIGIINGPMIFKPSFDRFAAYTEALSSRGIPIRNEYVCYGNFNEENSCDLTVKLIKSNPSITAIFAANTAISRGCLLAFEQCNIHIPDDMAFISYGDDFSFGLKNLNISVISDPDIEIGCQAANLLLQRIKQVRIQKNRNPERIIVTPNIILRGSEVYPKNCERARQ